MDADRVTSPAHNDPFQQAVATGRLRKLGAMGLAEDLGGGRWRLAAEMEQTLRRTGERGDIIRLMQREMTARGLERAPADRVIEETLRAPIIGRVIQRGFSDEHRDRHYLMIDGIDGRAHYLDIGRATAIEPTPEGTVVRVAPRKSGIREVDRMIAAVGQAQGGLYSIDRHLAHDPGASRAFAEAHVRRLEAMRRAGLVERLGDDNWQIADDHLELAAVYEARQLRDRPVALETLSSAPIERLASADSPTWLDRTLAGEEKIVVRDAGFGREVRDALAGRRQWLVQQGLAVEAESGVQLKRGTMALLQRRELLRIADELVDELGKPHVEIGRGARIEGRLTRRIEAVGARYALVERSREFSLVPWRPVLERQLGKSVAGIMRTDGINWQLGRNHELQVS